ncbi:MAG: TetR/AcrR family transcriptional regulator [Planctomycetes bacterium]|nr:TetR/AcrR family transcriptional regulator [Planctomycetota bacterium]
MNNGRINIGAIRREQIVHSAVAVINEQGIQKLSLSEIEKKVGMSRGQLTYYFKTKEEILLAVFDRLIALMGEWHGEAELDSLPWLEIVRHVLDIVLADPPAHSEFHALQHAFLSQISHRADFRRRLADLYEHWRGRSVTALKRDLKKHPSSRAVSPRVLATLVQAIFHGLAVQRAADPTAVDAEQVTELCLDMLQSYLGLPDPSAKKRPPSRAKRNRKVSHGRN